MNARMKRGFILCALATALFACGDDEDGGSAGSGGSDGASGSGGSSASGSGGTAGSSAGAGGSGGRGGGFQTQMCPAEEPALGSTCTPARGDCMFGERICDCSNDSMTWACWNPADCPTTLPAEQSACDVVGMECDYGQGDSCECAATGWDCGNQFCPAAEPAAGSACEGGDGVCTFGARVCDCDSDIWACWNMTDCPATPPAEESVCPLEGMICPYEGGECECDGPDGWDCDRGVMNEDPDADAGV